MSEISLGKCAIFTSSQMITDEFRRSMRLESYFYLGNRMVHPVLYIKDNAVVVDTTQVKVTSKWYITLIKIISYITIIIPIIIGIIVWIKRRNIIVQTHVDALLTDALLTTDPAKCLQKLNEQKGNLNCLGTSSNQWEKAICDWNPGGKTPEQQTAFTSCVDFLISHRLVLEEALFKKAVNQHKSPPCIDLLLGRGNISAKIQEESLVHALLIMDPAKCLQKLNEQKGNLNCLGISSDRWEEAICDWNPHTKTPEQQTVFKSCVDFLISHRLVLEEALFKKAVNQHKSPSCVQLLLGRGNINAQIQEESLREAVQCNHADIVLVLCNRDMQKTVRLFFDKFNGLNESEMRHQWTALFRLNSIELVDSMMDRFVQSFNEPIRREEINRILVQVRHDCMQWLPHVSQHDKPIDLASIQNAYQKNDDATLAAVDRDRVYGMRCFDWVNQLLASYRQNRNLEPQSDSYRQLPAGLNGGRTVAWFTEQVAIFRNQARQGNTVELRGPSVSFWTPIPIERYRWGYTLMGENLSQHHICSSFYKGKELSSVQLFRWHHGRQPYSFTWPDIEDQFQSIMTMNPADNPQQFYRSLIQLVWLIGNTTPLTRGTGSIVESMWAFVHRYWNLPVPILKKEYPQFDVINISSTLETYQNIWSNYFDPPTLMPAFQRANSS